MLSEKFLRQMIREIIDDELEEANTSGAAGPYNTPYAFQGTSSGAKKKRKDTAQQNGLKVVDRDPDPKPDKLTEEKFRFKKREARVAEGTKARLFSYDLSEDSGVRGHTVYNGKNWSTSPVEVEVFKGDKVLHTKKHKNRRMAEDTYRTLRRALRERRRKI